MHIEYQWAYRGTDKLRYLSGIGFDVASFQECEAAPHNGQYNAVSRIAGIGRGGNVAILSPHDLVDLPLKNTSIRNWGWDQNGDRCFVQGLAALRAAGCFVPNSQGGGVAPARNASRSDMICL